MKYYVDFYKTKNLSADERSAMRKNQRGLWLCTGFRVEADNPHAALAAAKREENRPLGVGSGFKLRARRA